MGDDENTGDYALDESTVRMLDAEEGLTSEERGQIKEVLSGKDTITVPQELLGDSALAASTKPAKATDLSKEDDGSANIRALLSEMKLPQKIKVAMFGNAVCRGLLIRDSNKIIQACVLKNPKLTSVEVAEFAKNAHLSDLVLRTIARNTEWTRDYPIKLNLVSNPKTPPDVGLKWLRHLTEGDIKRIARSKNVSQLIATTAKKIVASQEGRK